MALRNSSKGLSRRFRHSVGSSLDRYGLRPSREAVVRMDQLADRVALLEHSLARTSSELEKLQFVIDALRRPDTLNDSSGHLVVSRYRPLLSALARDTTSSTEFLEAVESDVGTIVFPSFDRFILPSIRDRGVWEPEENEYLRSHLRPGMTTLDIGANVGYTALVMSKVVGDEGLVIALEPEPLNFNLLCTNIKANAVRNVLPIHAAAGEDTGSTLLERSPDNAGDHRTAPHPMGIAALEVPLVAIDNLLPSELRVDFVFVDAQGYDHRIVRGMASVIDRMRPPMMLEFWPVGILGLGDDPDEVLEEYRKFGYRIALLPDMDVTDLSAEAILSYGDKDHVTISLTPR
jgi:FkbM family methyltransferase